MQEILIIRSCHMMQFAAACEFLKGKYPEATLTAVLQNSSIDDVKTQVFVDNIIAVEKSSPWDINTLSDLEKQKLSAVNYDMLVIPYNNHSGVRYQNVEKFIKVVNKLYVMMYMTDGKTQLYSLADWKKYIICRNIFFIFSKVLLAFLIVVSFCLWIFSFLFKPFLKTDKKSVTFFSPQNFNYPSARIRCYDFARLLDAGGRKTDIIGYDNLLKIRKDYDPIPEEMADFRKIWVNIVVFFKLIFVNRSKVYVLQKIKYNALAAYLVSFIKNTVLVIDMDDDEFTSPVFNFLKAEKLFSFICKTRKVIGVAASKRLYERMSECTETVFYVPTVVDTQRFYPKTLEENIDSENIIFCWSGIVFGPPVFENIEFVLEAFRKVYLVNKKVKLKIAVRGPLLKLLEIKIKDSYSDIPLEMTEWIAPDKMREFYVSADVGLNPLVRKDEFTLCKSPTKLFEYMACGLPSVTHKIGEAISIVNDGVDGFLADDIDDFVKKMLLLAENKTLRTKMGQNAYNTIKDKYCLKSAKDKLDEVFSAADTIGH